MAADADVKANLDVEFLPIRDDVTGVRLTVSFTAMRKGLMRPLARECVVSFFRIGGESASRVMITDTAVYLPGHLAEVIMETALAALRGILAIRTRGTALFGRSLPSVSVDSLSWLSLNNGQSAL